MARKIIKPKEGERLDDLARDLMQGRPSASVSILREVGMIVIDDDESVSSFKKKFDKHKGIKKIVDGDQAIKPTDQAIDFSSNSTMSASWPLARIIRRAPPWNKNHVRAPINTFFRSVRTGAGVDCYIVDSGIEAAHSEFGGRATNLSPVIADTGSTGDDWGHGTLCASAMAGGTAGVARGALIWGCRVAGAATSGSASLIDIISGINTCVSHYNGRSGLNRPAVMNLSWSAYGSGGGEFVGDAAATAMAAGIVVCASASNDLADVSTFFGGVYPGIEPDVICCGGLSMNDGPSFHGIDGTNFGSRVDIMAPGQHCYVAAASARGLGANAYEPRRGTSISAPYVAGVVACMLQGHNRLNNLTKVQAVRTKLLANATTGQFVSLYGLSPLPDRILYLDPDQAAPETIAGL